MVVAAGPAAFMSYVRFDDAHDDGQLSAFRERLAAEVRMQTGDEFPIFQDRNDIAWGQNWRKRIEETLDAVTLLLVIVTPGLFKSPACRDEVTRFLEREKELGRGDLILPVYYVSARQMDDPEARTADELASLLWSRQYADWRDLQPYGAGQPNHQERLPGGHRHRRRQRRARGQRPDRQHEGRVVRREGLRAERDAGAEQGVARTLVPGGVVAPHSALRRTPEHSELYARCHS
jgi:TIR domain